MTKSVPPSVQIMFNIFRERTYSNPLSTQALISAPPADSPSTTQALISAPPIDPPFSTIRTLSRAPFVSAYAVDNSLLLFAEEFFEDNPLIAATLRPQTQQKYAIALNNFYDSQPANDPAALGLDHRLAIYIQERYLKDSRPGQRQDMANLLCMLLIMYPNIRHDLGIARRCLAGWKTLHPSRAVAQLTTVTNLAFANHMFMKGHPASATTLMLTFFGCLRVSEALNLKWEDLALPGDLRLSSYEPGVAGFNVTDAKTARYTGQLQFVKLTSDYAIALLQHLADRPHTNEDKVAKVSYQTYTMHLKQTVKHFGFTDNVFTSHSARVGKATEDYIQDVPTASIAIQGRWKSLNSLRYYLNNGKAWLLKHAISAGHQQSIKDAATNLATLLQQPPPPAAALPSAKL